MGRRDRERKRKRRARMAQSQCSGHKGSCRAPINPGDWYARHVYVDWGAVRAGRPNDMDGWPATKPNKEILPWVTI